MSRRRKCRNNGRLSPQRRHGCAITGIAPVGGISFVAHKRLYGLMAMTQFLFGSIVVLKEVKLGRM